MKKGIFPSKNSLYDLHSKLLVPFSQSIAEIERNGFPINMEVREEMAKKYEIKLNKLIEEVRSFPEIQKFEKDMQKPKAKKPFVFNINSTKQLGIVFFDYLGLHTTVKTATGNMSTNEQALEEIKKQHEIGNLIYRYRKYFKMYSTYVEGVKKFEINGRVHTNYKVNGTVTGRLSSSQPNMQNIPRKQDSESLGFEFDPSLNIKRMFEAPPGYYLIQADYSQMELRVLADYSQEPSLINAFKNGEDIHLSVARQIANDPSLTKDAPERTSAKAVNFGIVYGRGPKSLAEELGWTVEEAIQFTEEYFRKIPGVKKFIDNVKEYLHRHGQVTSMWGRVRRLGKIYSSQDWIVKEAERQGVNHLIQSTASDYTAVAICRINKALKKYKLQSKMVGTVHDSIMVLSPKNEVKRAGKLIKKVMESTKHPLMYWKISTPLIADLEYGKNWMKLKELKV